MSITGISQNYFSISKKQETPNFRQFSDFLNTILTLSSKPFELQTCNFYTRQEFEEPLKKC